MSEKDLSKHNHVVRTTGYYGTWGRGRTKEEAMKNADLDDDTKEPFTLFVFKNDNWDILDTGSVTWNDDDLISREEF